MTKILSLLSAFILFANCGGYNKIQENDEKVNSAWAEVLNQYKRRTDLIPALVKTVQGAADFEKSVLTDVTRARSNVGGIQVTPEILKNPDELQKFMTAQTQLSGALQRLLVVAEKYPDLKSNENFLSLQSQIEGTENRLAVSRTRYIKAVEEYNLSIRQIPGNIYASIFGYKPKASFTIENADAIKKMDESVAEPPKVDFGK